MFRLNGQRALLAALMATVCAGAGATDPGAAATPRVQQLLAQMSRVEKMAVIRGAYEPAEHSRGQAGWIRGVPRLHIPDLRFADGPPGVLVQHASTGMPTTLSMAATFSGRDAEATGAVIGRDARALGIDVILQPFINLQRDPTWERAYNTFGEDPMLTGALAAAFVRGAQAQNVMAQAKHFVAYDGAANAIVDPQTLREVYIAPFRDAAQAGLASVMCAYSRVNGVHACGDDGALNGILRGEDGFTGFVTSDWGAAHGAEFILRGMDMEQPGGGPKAYFALTKEPDEPEMSEEERDDLTAGLTYGVPEEQGFPAPPMVEEASEPVTGVSLNLGEALAKGSVTDADIDRAVARVLAQIERFGWLDHAPNHAVTAQDIAANAREVQRLAEDGAVLLKNDGALPLKDADLRSLALIGPGAVQPLAIVVGHEQSFGRAERQIGVAEVLRRRGVAKGVTVAVADDMTGEAIPASAFADLKLGDGTSGAVTVEHDLDRTLRTHRALPAGAHARWDGTLEIPASGEYEIALQILGAKGKFYIDGRKVGTMGWWGGHGDIVFANRDNVVPTTDGLDNVRRLVSLSKGAHALRVEANADSSGAPVQVRLAWVTPAQKQSNFDAAVAAARHAKTAVVFAWSRNRPYFGLPGEQDRLIDAVAAVNPNTIVVLDTGQAVAMPWLDKVRAVLELWYTGDEGGWAAANLLTGVANPAGRLPITWPRRLQDLPANDPRHRDWSSAGVGGKTVYGEGLHVGYRWFEREHIEPLFAFGHGLSYTRFAYAKPAVARAADGGLDVSCDVRNSGARAGEEVVQAYVSAPQPRPAGADFAVRALAAFDRVSIPPGETRRVRLHIAPERLRYWSPVDHAWHDASAGRTINLGSSSRDLPLSIHAP